MVSTGRIRIAGIACVIGSVLWVIVLMANVVAHRDVYGSATSYRIWEALLILVHGLLLVGIVGLAWSGVAGTGWLGRIGLGLALLGRASFLVGEIRSFIQGKDDELFVPLGAIVTGLGMLLVGIAAMRARRWGGWHRIAPLLVGLYPFVAMFPLLAITGAPPTFTIALWGIPWLLLGLALSTETGVVAMPRHSAAAAAHS